MVFGSGITAQVMQAESEPGVFWYQSDVEAFAVAKRDNKPILLYLEAVWCHWCHVMDHETYADPAIIKLLNRDYVALRIDQDSRPDLANRYLDYGWPATIFFTPDGRDMVKRAGYIAPKHMLSLLKAILDDPSPEAAAKLTVTETTASSTVLSQALRAELQLRHETSYDVAVGGLKAAQKYLERDSVEYALLLAAEGNVKEHLRAKQTLDAAMNLSDPIWGGFYQYSTGFVWTNQHFEKLAKTQSAYLRAYSLAAAQFDDAAYEAVAVDIKTYLKRFLQDEQGGFYTSQDADLIQGEHADGYFKLDDKARRVLGLPRIDKNIYTSDNGGLIEALALRYELTGDAEALEMARRAALQMLKTRLLPSGGFRHNDKDSDKEPGDERLYLADNLNMGRGLLALYRATAEPSWLKASVATLLVIERQFSFAAGGYAAAVQGDSPLRPVPQLDENLSLVRFANLLFQISGEPLASKVATRTMYYLATPSIATRRLTEAGILLAERELSAGPLHLTVVGSKQDERALSLFTAASRLPVFYKRVEWWDRQEGPLLNPDVTYPELKRAAVFVCTDQRCSVPLYSSADMLRFLVAADAQ